MMNIYKTCSRTPMSPTNSTIPPLFFLHQDSFDLQIVHSFTNKRCHSSYCPWKCKALKLFLKIVYEAGLWWALQIVASIFQDISWSITYLQLTKAELWAWRIDVFIHVLWVVSPIHHDFSIKIKQINHQKFLTKQTVGKHDSKQHNLRKFMTWMRSSWHNFPKSNKFHGTIFLQGFLLTQYLTTPATFNHGLPSVVQWCTRDLGGSHLEPFNRGHVTELPIWGIKQMHMYGNFE